MNYVLFSIDNVHDTRTLAKFLRHFDTQVAMSRTKGYLVQCIGSYRGQLELSFICDIEDYFDYVEPYGATKNQEYIWGIYGNNMNVTSMKPDGSDEKCLSYLEEVTKEDAMKAEGFTYRPDVNTYWTLKV